MRSRLQVVVTNPNNGRKWRLRPYQNGLCLMIEKSPISKVNPKNGREVKSEFVSCDRYPSTWQQGVRMMLQMALMDPEDSEELVIDDIEKDFGMFDIAMEKKVLDITWEVTHEAH